MGFLAVLGETVTRRVLCESVRGGEVVYEIDVASCAANLKPRFCCRKMLDSLRTLHLHLFKRCSELISRFEDAPSKRNRAVF